MKLLRSELLLNRSFTYTAILGLIISLLGLVACGNESLEAIEAFEQEMNSPAEVGQEVELIYSDSGHIKARVTAPVMERYITEEQSYLEMPEGLIALFYDRALNIVSTVEADHGIRYTNQKRTELRDNVLIVNEEGDSLQTEQLIWDESQDKVYSERHVRVKTTDEIINAQGFESDMTFSNYKFYKITDSEVLVETE